MANTQSDIDAFERLFTSVSLTAPTNYSNRAKDITGGFVKIGNLVFVHLQFTSNLALTAQFAVLTGMPKPRSFFVPLNVVVGAQSVNELANGFVNSSGSFCIGDAVAINTLVTVAGCYVS